MKAFWQFVLNIYHTKLLKRKNELFEFWIKARILVSGEII